LSYRLSFLWSVFRETMVDVSLDRGFSTSSFGNYWVGSIGGRIPF
jgi:hypothetical protein